MYGMTGANVDNISQAPASPPTAAASSSSPSPQPSLSLSRSSSPLPLIAGLFSPSSGHNGGGGGRRRRHGAGIGRTTADVFIPVPTADPCGLARRAVAAGATLEAMGATGGAAAERQQHVMVRPPGGALVLVLTAPAAAPAEEEGGEGGRGSKASRPKSTTKAPPPTGAADADDEDGQGQGEEEAGEQEVGLEAGEAGIGTYFPTLRIEHKCCRNPGEVYANTPRPIPYVSVCRVWFDMCAYHQYCWLLTLMTLTDRSTPILCPIRTSILQGGDGRVRGARAPPDPRRLAQPAGAPAPLLYVRGETAAVQYSSAGEAQGTLVLMNL